MSWLWGAAKDVGSLAGNTTNATFSAAAQLTSGAAGVFVNQAEAEVTNNTDKSVMVMWWGYQDTAYTGYDGCEILAPGASLHTLHAKPDPAGVQIGVVHTVQHPDIVDYICCILSCSSETLNLGSCKLFFQLVCCKAGSPISIESVHGHANDPKKGRVTFSGDTWWSGRYDPQWSTFSSSSLGNCFAGTCIDLGQLGLDLFTAGSTAGAKAVAKKVAKELAKACINEFKTNLKSRIKAMAKEEGLRLIERMLETKLSGISLPPYTIKSIAKLLLEEGRETIEANSISARRRPRRRC